MPTENYTSSGSYTLDVSDVNVVSAELLGARGSNNSDAGRGGKITGDIDVSSYDTMYIKVAGGRFVGGGDSGFAEEGGGASDIRLGGDTLNDRVLVAGGGGGVAESGEFDYRVPGGDGGLPDGQRGGSGGGYGGSQNSGGAGGNGSNGANDGGDGSFGAGGVGGDGRYNGGGGGGGWYGGGGGGGNDQNSNYADGGGGGGGSSYYDSALVSNVTDTTGANNSETGEATLTYTIAPDDPTSLTATVEAGTVDLSWANTDNTVSVRVFRSTSTGVDKDNGTQVADLAAGTESYTDTTVNDGTEYHYVVYAYDSANDVYSSSTNEETVFIELPPLTNLEVTGVRDAEADVRFEDNANNKHGYRVFAGPDGHLQFDNDVDEKVAIDGPGWRPSEDQFAIGGVFEGTPDGDDGTVIMRSHSGNSVGIHWTGNSYINAGWRGDNIYNVAAEVGETDKFGCLAVFDGPNNEIRLWVNGQKVGYTSTDPNDSVDADTLDATWDVGGDSRLSGSSSSSSKVFNAHQAVLLDGLPTDSEAVAISSGESVSRDMVAEFHFNQGSGNTLVDYSGNGNDGTLQNGPTWVGGGPLSKNGGDIDPQYGVGIDSIGYIEVPNDPAIEAKSSGFSVFIRASHGADRSHHLVGTSQDFYGHGWNISRAGNPEEMYAIVVDGNENQASPNIADYGTPYPPTTFGFTFDGTTVQSYINGSPGDSESNPNLGTISSGNPLSIGRRINYGNNVDKAVVDELIGYDRVLTDSEFQELENGVYPPNPEFHYKFNDGVGSTSVTDSTGNAPDGNFVGDAEWVAPLAPVQYTLSDLRNGEAYVTRASVFTDDAEAFDN